MSTRSSRQLGNKYIKPEDIQNVIYDSDEENPEEILIGEAKETRDKTVLKAAVREHEDCVKNVCFSVIDNQEGESVKQSGRLNELSEKWCGVSRLTENKLNNSVSKEQDNQEIKSVFNCIASNKESDSGELKDSRKEISGEYIEDSSEDENQLFQSVRKRPSPGDGEGDSAPKKFKVELDKEMSDAPATKPLKIELELEKNRRNEPIKKRNVNAITEELDEISRRWHDTYSRCKPTFQWGPPITRNCSEKWDFHSLPQKIFEAYHKPIEECYPRTGETSYERGDVDYKIVEARGVRIDTEKVDEASEALDYEQYKKFSDCTNPMEDDFHGYNSEGPGKMVLRSTNQNRNRSDGRISGDEHSSKEKTSKKSNKDHQKLINPNRQLVVELERCHPHRQYQNEDAVDSNKNFEHIKGNYENYGASSQMNASKSHYEDNSAQGPMRANDDDKVVCPICQDKFDKNHIESHASNCATATFEN